MKNDYYNALKAAARSCLTFKDALAQMDKVEALMKQGAYEEAAELQATLDANTERLVKERECAKASY